MMTMIIRFLRLNKIFPHAVKGVYVLIWAILRVC